MDTVSFSAPAALQATREALVALLGDVSERARVLAGTAEPLTPLPLNKTPLEIEALTTRLAAALNASSVRLEHAEVSAVANLALLGTQIASVVNDGAQFPHAASEALARTIHTATEKWLTSLLGLLATKSVDFATSELEALATVCRTAFAWKFEAHAEDGFRALYSRPPVIYVSDHTVPSLLVNLATLLMLPASCIRKVPSVEGGAKMNTAEFERLVEHDIENGLTPTLLVARAETPITGELDDLLNLRVICEKHRIWTHLTGTGLISLVQNKSLSPTLTAAISADSVAVNPATWLRLPACPIVTCFRATTPRTVTSGSELALTLPLWFALQSQGQNHLISAVGRAIETASALVQTVSTVKCLAVLPRVFEGQYVLLSFQSGDARLSESYASGVGNDFIAVENMITRTLYESTMAKGAPLGVDLITHHGLAYLRYRPFTYTEAHPQSMTSFAHDLASLAVLYDATWSHQQLFEKACKQRKLSTVPVEGYFGLGAVRYIPPYVDVNTLSEQTLADLDDLNAAILAKLQEEDPRLFQQGHVLGSTQVCIRVGVTTSPVTEIEVNVLADAIAATASAVEKTSKFMDDMAEIVRRNIESAQSHIAQQLEMELEEDLLRQIPLVGSLFTFFSPDQGKKKAGRYFSLQHGKVGSSSEVIQVSTPPSPAKPAAAQADGAAAQADANGAVHTEHHKHAEHASNSSISLVHERAAAIDAVARAARICESVFVELVSDDTLVKTDASPVTIADFAAQAVIHSLIHHAFPHDRLISEEESSELREPRNAAIKHKVVELVNSVLDDALDEATILANIDLGSGNATASGRVWTLDPIDGTKGFVRGGQYAICLTLLEDGMPVMAVMGCPNLPVDPTVAGGDRGCIFLAIKGQGAWQRPLHRGQHAHEHRLAVSSTSEPANAVLCESFEESHSMHNQVAHVAGMLGILRPSLRFDSQCKYACVARGEATLYVRLQADPNYVEKIWDHAAGWLLVHEAGGLVTDAHGRALHFSAGRLLQGNSGIVASNGHLHERTLAAIAQLAHSNATDSL